MVRLQTILRMISLFAFPVFLGAFAYIGIELFGRGADPDRLLPAAYVVAGAFVVLVPCLLFRIYVKFDRKYRSENNPNQPEEKK